LATIALFSTVSKSYGLCGDHGLPGGWEMWWSGLVVTPLILFWSQKNIFYSRGSRFIEAIFFSIWPHYCYSGSFLAVFLLSRMRFHNLCVPVLMWVALRRTQLETVFCILLSLYCHH